MINDFDIEGFKALAENLAATGVRLNSQRAAAISLSRPAQRDLFAADKDRGDRASGSHRAAIGASRTGRLTAMLKLLGSPRTSRKPNGQRAKPRGWR